KQVQCLPHLRRSNGARLHRTSRTGAMVAVGAMNRISVIIGQVGKDLQEDGGNDAKKKNIKPEGSCFCGKKASHADTSNSQGQGAQPKGAQPCFNVVRV